MGDKKLQRREGAGAMADGGKAFGMWKSSSTGDPFSGTAARLNGWATPEAASEAKEWFVEGTPTASMVAQDNAAAEAARKAAETQQVAPPTVATPFIAPAYAQLQMTVPDATTTPVEGTAPEFAREEEDAGKRRRSYSAQGSRALGGNSGGVGIKL